MKQYSEHRRIVVAVDCIIFGYEVSEKKIKLLVIKRNFEPAKGRWSLAGGFVGKEESLDEAADRILRKLTGLENIYLKQFYSYGKVDRDPGERVISTAYYSLIKIQNIDNDLKKDGACWKPLEEYPDLIFDHPAMVERAVQELQMEAKVKPVGFELLPEKFTLVQLQDLYEAIYQRAIDKRNFRKKILSMNLLERLNEKEKVTSRKGAYFYKFNMERYFKFEKNGFYFNMDIN
jgi:ADP-ribose pyrophosphatase YjhB (NUDIX family)